MRLAAENGFRISPNKLPLAIPLLATAPANSVLAWLQHLLYGRRIARAVNSPAPVFIIGHFRSGTTHLYELLSRDPRFATPTAYDCFAAAHFVLTRRWLAPLLTGLVPRRRPMDGMAFGLDRPQEDEFALLALGAPTIYRRLGFPREPLADVDAVADELDERRAIRLVAALRRFYGALALVNGSRRMLVKSPVHTGRIRLLLKLFPDARFVHLVRDPRAMFSSLQYTWRVLEITQSLQSPANDRHRDEIIFEVMDRMYRGYMRDRPLLAPKQLCQVRYEELTTSPLQQLERIYDELQLGGFSDAKPRLAEYLSEIVAYQPNSFQLSEQTSHLVKSRWDWYFREFHY